MSSNNSDKRKRHLTVLQRLEIVKLLEECVPPKCIAKQFGVTLPTIYHIRKKAAYIMQEVDKQYHIHKNAKRVFALRAPALQELDNKLYFWFVEQSTVGNIVNDKLLREKAVELNANCGGPSTYNCGRAWLWRFKKRHGIGEKDEEGEEVQKEEAAEENADEHVANAMDVIVKWSNKQFDLLVQSHANALKDFFDQERKTQ